MNIFYLDQNPKQSAQYHCSRHVVKMILESAQMLCTAIRIIGGKPIVLLTPNNRKKLVYMLPNETYKWVDNKLILSSGLYIQTHANHPCSIWVRKSFANWNYVWNLMYALDTERQFRYSHNKEHKSIITLKKVDVFL